FPDVPTAAEQGYPEIDANVWVGLFAPAAMPQPLVERIHREVSAILRDPDFKAREIEAKGYDLEAEGPEEMRRHIRAELRSRAAPIRYSGAKAE
ncbi:MAG: tripartite tricarboxylate transporter substrate binding protein, partial [Ramlibacter sp.]|nr:tripartite tricarboxylate transporter substrate binding protein [Ramlibacter sp.]